MRRREWSGWLRRLLASSLVFRVCQKLLSKVIFLCLVVTVYPTLGEEAITFALGECDAVAIFTARSLLSKVALAIKDCPEIKNVVYFSELHEKPGTRNEAGEALNEEFKNSNRNLYPFEAIVQMGDTDGTVFLLSLVYKMTRKKFF